jgi:hypothetical protein
MAWLGSAVAGTIPIRPCADWPHLAPYLETCSSAHHWARQLMALGFEVRLIPHAHVKPYVWRNKSDAADAAVICEAARQAGPAIRAGALDRQPGRADARSGARVARRPKERKTGKWCETGRAAIEPIPSSCVHRSVGCPLGESVVTGVS